MDSAFKTFGDRIRYCAKKVGSGNELARLTGVSRRALENWLQGRNEPKASVAALIAKAAGVSLEWLISGVGSPDAEKEKTKVNNSVEENAQNTVPDDAHSVEDTDFLGEILEELYKHYNKIGRKIEFRQLGATAADLYHIISKETKELAEQRLALKVALKMIKLEEPESKNDSSGSNENGGGNEHVA